MLSLMSQDSPDYSPVLADSFFFFLDIKVAKTKEPVLDSGTPLIIYAGSHLL